MEVGPSFASRRPAATGLPAFSLPPPDIPSTRYPASASLPPASSFSSLGHSFRKPVLSPPSASARSVPLVPSNPHLPIVSGVLTPSSGVANDGLSPLSSGVNTGSSMSSQPGTTAGTAGVNYSYMAGSWPVPQTPSAGGSYSYSGSGNHNQVTSPLLNQPFPNVRSIYQQVSPSVPQFTQSSGRHPLPGHPLSLSSPAIPEGLPPPAPYHQTSPVFLTPISGLGGGGGGSNTGSHQVPHSQGPGQSRSTPTSAGHHDGSFRAAQQHHQHQQQRQQQQQQEHNHQQQQRQQQHQHQQQHGSQYAYQRTTPQQSSFPTFSSNNSHQPQPSPTARTPPSADLVAASHAVRGMSLSAPGQMSGMAPPMGFNGSGRQGMGFGYQMPGPIMTNMHQPGTPMAVVGANVSNMMPGSYNPGPSPHGHGLHIYGQTHPQQLHQDKPFKCDQCAQSFNRNHDLKRHKRIHLAVKPYPCNQCDKSFSRKDALKVCTSIYLFVKLRFWSLWICFPSPKRLRAGRQSMNYPSFSTLNSLLTFQTEAPTGQRLW